MATIDLTLVTTVPIRNHIPKQEFILEKAICSCLTTLQQVTLCLAAVLAFKATLVTNAFCQSPSTHPFLSPSAITIHQTLQAPFGQVIESASLESILDGIASSHEIAIWCDRRVARDTVISIEKKIESLESFLNRAVENVGARLLPMDGVVLVVPKANRDGIDTAYWNLVVSRAASSMRPVSGMPFGWSDGATASDVILDFISSSSPKTDRNFKIEHDIWRAFEFRKTTTAVAIGTCLLSGFDLCLADRDGSLFVLPLSASESRVDWVYSKQDIETKIGESAWKAWRQRWTHATVAKVNQPNGWRVTANVAAHRELVRSMIPQKKSEKPLGGEKVFSGPLEGELELVIRSLAAQTKLDFFPLPLPPSLESKTIKLKLDKTTLDGILVEITKQCGVRFERNGQRVEIIP